MSSMENKKTPNKVTVFNLVSKVKELFYKNAIVRRLIDLVSDALTNHNERISFLEDRTDSVVEYLHKNEKWRRVKNENDAVVESIVVEMAAKKESKKGSSKAVKKSVKKAVKKTSKKAK